MKKVGMTQRKLISFRMNTTQDQTVRPFGQIQNFHNQGRLSEMSEQKKVKAKANNNSVSRNISGRGDSSSRLLRNMIESSEQKRIELLNGMINGSKVSGFKKKHLRVNSSSDESFKKMIKLKTERASESSSRDNISANSPYKMLPIQNLKNLNFVKPQPKALSIRESQRMRLSFNKRIKQIKLRKYFAVNKDQLEAPKNLFEAHGYSLIGEKHEQNQDSIYFSEGNYVLCDGHGSNGKQISQFICEGIHHSLNSLITEQVQNGHKHGHTKIDESAIKEVFKKMTGELQNEATFDVSFSGCTCLTVLRHENYVYCASLGDSKAILCRGFSVIEISTSHKPDNQQQKTRIQNYGGVVRQSDDKSGGPMRVWAPGKNSWGPGLAMSRAFGDKASRRYGVISVPSVTCVKLKADEDFIVMGSDGLFDVFENQELCQLIKKYVRDDIPREEIPEHVSEAAKKRWSSGSDDISCIVIFM